MASRISKVQRWLDLLSFLVGRRLPVSASEIMERVPGYAVHWNQDDRTGRATAQRTFERDKDELRRLEIPIETVSYTVGYGMETTVGYRLARRDFYLPYLKIVASAHPVTDSRGSDRSRVGEVEIAYEDARDALDALRHVAELPATPLAPPARSAFRKLALDLEPAAVHPAPLTILDASAHRDQLQILEILSTCLRERRRVRFGYRGIQRGELTLRQVEPYGLLHQGGSWYLVANDVDRDDMRVFRIGRMEGLQADSSGADAYQVPPDFDLRSYLHREAWELGEGESIATDVLFHFPRSLWAERNGYGVRQELNPDGSAIRRFQVQQPEPFVRWILSLEGEAEVIAPPELKEAVRSAAASVLALYAGGGSDGDA